SLLSPLAHRPPLFPTRRSSDLVYHGVPEPEQMGEREEGGIGDREDDDGDNHDRDQQELATGQQQSEGALSGRCGGRRCCHAAFPCPLMSMISSSSISPAGRRSVMRPSTTKAMSSQTLTSSAGSSEMSRTAVPSSATERIRSWISARDPTSTPTVGLLRISTRGRGASILDSRTRCWLPPDRAETGA